MRKNKKQRRVMFLLILILGLTIGFALLSTTLKINGSASIKSNTWDIHWDDTSVNVATGSVEADLPVVSKTTSDDDTVSFNVELDLPGDFYEFSVDAVNEGSVDGALELEENFITYKVEDQETTLPEYMDFKITYDDDTTPATGDVVEAGESQTYKIRVEFKSSVKELPENPEPITIEVNLPYVQHKTEESSSPWILPTGKTKDTLEVGDEICLAADTTQCFNFISYDISDIVMLAKYNLKVGGTYDVNTWRKTSEYTSSDPGYGLQSSEARGWVNGETSYGTVAFSATNYWMDGNNLKSPYNENDTIYYDSNSYSFKYRSDDSEAFPTIYDSVNYKTEPDFSTTCDSTHCFKTPGYSVAYYVDAYKTLLTNNGTIIKNARLLTYDEATDSSIIGCDASNWSCPTNGFITNTTFWLGSAYGSYSVWNVISDGRFSRDYFSDVDSIGVRPVVVISKDSI